MRKRNLRDWYAQRDADIGERRINRQQHNSGRNSYGHQARVQAIVLKRLLNGSIIVYLGRDRRGIGANAD